MVMEAGGEGSHLADLGVKEALEKASTEVIERWWPEDTEEEEEDEALAEGRRCDEDTEEVGRVKQEVEA